MKETVILRGKLNRTSTVYTLRAVMILLLFFICMGIYALRAEASSVTLNDKDGGTLSDAGTVYVIKGDGTQHVTTNYLDVPENASTESSPITIILDGVNISQEDKSPKHSFIHIEKGNYVVIKLRSSNYVKYSAFILRQATPTEMCITPFMTKAVIR